MAGYNPLNLGFTAGEDLVAGEVVYLSAADTVSKTTGALDSVVGVVYKDTSSGDKVAVQADGIAEVTASGAISVGNFVQSDANGQVAAFTATQTLTDSGGNTVDVPDTGKIIGIALEAAAAAGDKIKILLRR